MCGRTSANEQKTLRAEFSALSKEERLIAISVAAIFLPYFSGIALALGIFLYLFCHKPLRDAMRRIPGAGFLLILPPITLLASLRAGNWLGMLGALAALLLILYAILLLAVMTEPLFQFILRLCCVLSYVSFLLGALQMLLIRTNSGLYRSVYLLIDPEYFGGLLKAYTAYRSMSTFYNASYFAAIASFMVLLCVYKFLQQKQGRVFYLITAAVNIGSMLLAGSRTAFLSLGVGLLVILLCLKRYKLLSLVAGIALLLSTVFVLHPAWMPRFDSLFSTVTKRLDIWSGALSLIRTAPLFGRGLWGYMTYANAHPELQWAVHAHSIYLDLLLCFGLFGCALLIIYFVKICRSIKRSDTRPQNKEGALLLAFIALLLTSGLTDAVTSGGEVCIFTIFVFSAIALYLPRERKDSTHGV